MKVKIFPDTNRYFQICTSMKDGDKVEMLLFLLQNVDVFVWSSYEVPGVDPEFIIHKLNVDPVRISAFKSYCKMLCILLCMTLCMS